MLSSVPVSFVHQSAMTAGANAATRLAKLQCPRHKVELERTFNHKEHAFTVKVDARGTIKFLVKHAGIPKECECL